jgi:hypothetical protein
MINIIDLIKKLNQRTNNTKVVILTSLFWAISLIWLRVTSQTCASINSWLFTIPFKRFCWYHSSDHNIHILLGCHHQDKEDKFTQDNMDKSIQDKSNKFVQDNILFNSIGYVLSDVFVHDKILFIPNNCQKLCVQNVSIFAIIVRNHVLFCMLGIYVFTNHNVWSWSCSQFRLIQLLVHRNVLIYVTANKIDIDHNHRWADLRKWYDFDDLTRLYRSHTYTINIRCVHAIKIARCILSVHNANIVHIRPSIVMNQNNLFFDDSGIVCIASSHSIMSNICSQIVVPISHIFVFFTKTVTNKNP